MSSSLEVRCRHRAGGVLTRCVRDHPRPTSRPSRSRGVYYYTRSRPSVSKRQPVSTVLVSRMPHFMCYVSAKAVIAYSNLRLLALLCSVRLPLSINPELTTRPIRRPPATAIHHIQELSRKDSLGLLARMQRIIEQEAIRTVRVDAVRAFDIALVREARNVQRSGAVQVL